MGFFAVKIFFFASKPSGIFFSRQVVETLFFFYKIFFFKAQRANRIFFKTEHFLFFSIKFADKKKFSPKNIAPPPHPSS